MNFSAPFIHRPVATTLMAIGLLLAGVVAYFALPVASLPAFDLPTIRIVAARPGADPATMAASVAAPLERRISEVSGVVELTSSSSLGATVITAQFDLGRQVDKAARDIQAAINAAASDLPLDLPMTPIFRKANPSAMPVLVLALTSTTISPSGLYDAADTIIAQRLSRVEGVAEVQVSGAEQPAIRIQVDSAQLAAMGLGLDQAANAIIAANAHGPVGAFEGDKQGGVLTLKDQIATPEDYRAIVVRTPQGPVRLGDIAKIERGVRNSRAAGWFDGKPAVILFITKQPDANVIETVDRVKALLPELKRWIPAGTEISTLADRTVTIRASVAEVQKALAISICLVMAVVVMFLRNGASTAAAGVTVPLSLAGTFVCMKAVGFSIDNISLMALIVAVGFVVDDAIVIIENVTRKIEQGLAPVEAALQGSREIGFTVMSISLSLVAAFIPLIFLGGVPGKMFREFALTLVFAIAISTFVSLTVTPMICGRFLKARTGARAHRSESAFEALERLYALSLKPLVRHPWWALVAMAATIALSVQLFRIVPKGYIPQDDQGLIFSMTEAGADVSFPAMADMQQRATAIVAADPDVAHVASFIGGGTVNQGRIMIALKPEGERSGGSPQVISRLRRALVRVPGMTVYMFPVQDIRVGGRSSKAQYQFAVSAPALGALEEWTPKIVARLRALPLLTDVTTDREQGGLRANVVIDRDAAARLGVSINGIDTALNTAFGQRQASIIYTQRNQYRVVVENMPARQVDPTDLSGLYVTSVKGGQVPLAAVARVERAAQPLVVNHQGVFPATTVTFNLADDATLDGATQAVQQAVAEMQPPDALRTEFVGEARDFRTSSGGQGWLIVIALASVYLILGVLYESLIHPLTIISTLPSAGLGALLALLGFGAELTLIAFIGIILLIGIVKKNGIMLVDFAIDAERHRGLNAAEAAYEAALARFRPILMTTLAALFGALPLAFAVGAGAEMRRPLGITIVGGLILSQILTLYTTPAFYVLMDKLSRKKKPAQETPAPAAAE